MVVEYQNHDAGKPLGGSKRGGPARMDHLLEISQHRYGSLHQSGEVPRWQGTGRDAAREDIATTASRSRTMPKDLLPRLIISQSRVKWSFGASSCSAAA
jgi:hypothetical protein